jgi:hypothetical protein
MRRGALGHGRAAIASALITIVVCGRPRRISLILHAKFRSDCFLLFFTIRQLDFAADFGRE